MPRAGCGVCPARLRFGRRGSLLTSEGTRGAEGCAGGMPDATARACAAPHAALREDVGPGDMGLREPGRRARTSHWPVCSPRARARGVIRRRPSLAQVVGSAANADAARPVSPESAGALGAGRARGARRAHLFLGHAFLGRTRGSLPRGGLMGARASAGVAGFVRRGVCRSGCTQAWLSVGRRESTLPRPGRMRRSGGPGALRQPRRRVGTRQTGPAGASSGLGVLPGQPGRPQTGPAFLRTWWLLPVCSGPRHPRRSPGCPGYRSALLRGGGVSAGRGGAVGAFSLQLPVPRIDRFRLDDSSALSS